MPFNYGDEWAYFDGIESASLIKSDAAGNSTTTGATGHALVKGQTQTQLLANSQSATASALDTLIVWFPDQLSDVTPTENDVIATADARWRVLSVTKRRYGYRWDCVARAEVAAL